MTEELLRQWARDHAALVDIAIGVVVMLAFLVKLRSWSRAGVFKDPKAVPVALRADPAKRDAALPRMSAHSLRVWSFVLVLVAAGLVALGGSVAWSEFEWVGASTAPAQLLSTHASHGAVAGLFRVQPLGAPAFDATLTIVPRGSNYDGVAESMKNVDVFDVLSNPRRYRPHERSTSKYPRGWNLVASGAGIAVFFGGFVLIFAVAAYRAAGH